MALIEGVTYRCSGGLRDRWKGAAATSTAMFIFGLIGLSAASQSFAQTGSYLIPAKPRSTLQAPGTNTELRTHRNALGKPCLDFEAISRAHLSNTDIYDNIVSIKNQCAQRIMVKVCYFGSDSCIDVEVPAFQRKDVILGVRPQSQYFRYSYKEKR